MHGIDSALAIGTEPPAHAWVAHVSVSTQHSASVHAAVAQVVTEAAPERTVPPLHALKPAHVAVAKQHPSASSHSLDAQNEVAASVRSNDPGAQSSFSAVSHVKLFAMQHSVCVQVEVVHVNDSGNSFRSSSAAQAKPTHVLVMSQHSSFLHSGVAHVIEMGDGAVFKMDPQLQL
jgi:hypothetical protein